MREFRPYPASSRRLSVEEVVQRRTQPLSQRVLDDMSFLAQMMPDCSDWLEAKKRIMLELPIWERQLFSTREQRTKKHWPFNVFEQAVRTEWHRLTGNMLMMPDRAKMAGLEDGYL